MVNGATPKLTFASAPKLIGCDAWLTVKLRLTAGAAEYVSFPAWFAVIEQLPALTIVTWVPLTVQTEQRVVSRPKFRFEDVPQIGTRTSSDEVLLH